MKFKAVTFVNTSFINCYFEDVSSVGSFFRNCIFVDSFFYNTGKCVFLRFSTFLPLLHAAPISEVFPGVPGSLISILFFIFIFFRIFQFRSNVQAPE